MNGKVAIVEFDGDVQKAFDRALQLLGSLDELNSDLRSVVIKVGVFDHDTENHTTVDVVRAIACSFGKAPQIYLAESDNNRGNGLERLQIWRELFSARIIPFNLSTDAGTRKVGIAGEEMNFSHILFKPNVFVSTHILRSYEHGSILKNLFGLIPDRKKRRFHKKLPEALLDSYEAIGGVDLAVLDGTYLYHGVAAVPRKGPDGGECRTRMNTLLVGRDAVAVETVGVTLAGLNPMNAPVIREAVHRGLGEGDIGKIEIVGASFEETKARFASALQTFRKKKDAES